LSGRAVVLQIFFWLALPLSGRWALGMTVTNLLDSEHETIRGYPAPGVGVALSVERRF
jgi:outer membrane cobalamin receptor